MKKFVTDLLTEDDAKSWCWARVAASIGLIAYLFNAGFILYHTGVLSLTDFANGFATLIAASGAAIAMKQFSTAKPTDTQPIAVKAATVASVASVASGTPVIPAPITVEPAEQLE
jgi:hypothetical protein